MAANADPFYRALAPGLAAATGLDVECVEDAPWQARQERFERGEAEVAFACGVYYTRQVDEHRRRLGLLAAPVPAAPRYGGCPVYFSDVVVRRDSGCQSFAELQGRSLAYNEPGSHSGYNIVRWYLASRALGGTFFGRVVEAGSHQAAMRLVAGGKVEAAAIDATVLEMELQEHPWLSRHLRVLHTLGPSPIPPALAAPHLPEGDRSAVRDALLRLHTTESGRRLLALGRFSRFAAVADEDYAPIRRMDRLARTVTLQPSGSLTIG
jgi:phosphonate transport system substrate-binding protein